MLGHRFDLGPGVVAAVSDRHGGASTGPYTSLNLGDHVGDDPAAVAANRAALAAAVGADRVAVARQVHGTGVVVVDEPTADAGTADALLTDRPGVAVAVLVADCAPVVLWDPARRAVAVVHAGRPGATLDVVGAAVTAMANRYGSVAGDLRAGVGPCVAAASYEVGPAEVAATRAAFGDDADALLTPTRDGHACFDLRLAVGLRLAGAGVDPDAVEWHPDDTRTSTGTWFSDRAERPCGRFGLIAMVSPATTGHT